MLLCYYAMLCCYVILCYCCVIVVLMWYPVAPHQPPRWPSQPLCRIYDSRFRGSGISLVGFVMVYSVSGQRMACTVIIVIYHDAISIVHVIS